MSCVHTRQRALRAYLLMCQRANVSLRSHVSMCFFLVTLFRVGFLCLVAYLTVANSVRLGILVHCQVSIRSQYLFRLLSLLLSSPLLLDYR